MNGVKIGWPDQVSAPLKLRSGLLPLSFWCGVIILVVLWGNISLEGFHPTLVGLDFDFTAAFTLFVANGGGGRCYF